jgi:hypothetical protein
MRLEQSIHFQKTSRRIRRCVEDNKSIVTSEKTGQTAGELKSFRRVIQTPTSFQLRHRSGKPAPAAV